MSPRPPAPEQAIPSPAPSLPAPTLTVIIPTFNEGANVPELVRRLAAALPDASPSLTAELLFVDDSTDDTPAIIRSVAASPAASSGLPVRLLHRAPAERTGGLSGAVAAGIRAARGDVIVVMDGDLQHPPETVPILLATLLGASPAPDLVVASRYVSTPDASAAGLSSGLRRLVSSSSTTLARACFPRRVGRVCTDPMTGFFAFRADSIDPSRLHPRGFKILLELLARHDLAVAEVPFVFAERHAGTSKASARQGLEFLHQLASLRFGALSRFAVIGVLGTVVNLAVLALLLAPSLPLDGNYLVAAVVAAEVSILHNFLLQERFVFRHVRDGVHSYRGRLARHFVFNNLEALIRLPLLALLVERVRVHPVPAQASLLLLAFVARFLFTSRVVYRPAPVPPVLVPDANSDSEFASDTRG